MTPTQEPEVPANAPDVALDRRCWETLRRAALLGNLQPEGFELVTELHARYPQWVEEWSP
jgi:hypothetical protein